MRIGVLAVQGAFAEHLAAVRKRGAEAFEIRNPSDLVQPFDGLILPGGESTVMKTLLHDLNLYVALKTKIENGLPVLGTCAGMILLANQTDSGEKPCFGTMNITVRRNAYGRQLGSFVCMERFANQNIMMRFIRAPYVTKVGGSVEILSEHDRKIVAVRQDNQLATAFHPELTEETAVYDLFFRMIARSAGL